MIQSTQRFLLNAPLKESALVLDAIVQT